MLQKIIFALFACCLGLRPLLASIAFPLEDIYYSLALILLSLAFFVSHIRTFPPGKNPPVFYVLLFFLAIAVSTVYSSDQEKSLRELYKYTAFFSVYFATLASTPDNGRKLTLALVASATCVSILSLQMFLAWTLPVLDHLRVNYAGWNFGSEFLSRGRAFMPFSLPTDLAGYLILFFPVSAALLLEEKNRPAVRTGLSTQGIFALLAVTAISLALLCTQSLGALLSLIAAFAIFPIKKNVKRNRRIWALSLLFFGALTFILWSRFTDQNLFNLPTFSLGSRLSYWSHALNVIREHPVVGVGPGNYPFFKGVWAHNAYLHIWAEMGILGCAALLGIGFTVARSDLKTCSGSGEKIFSGLWIGAIAFLLHNIVDTTLLHPEVSLQAWAVFALLNGARRGSLSRGILERTNPSAA